jgi:SP family myo-inositol transporter-like MFS transporter 13
LHADGVGHLGATVDGSEAASIMPEVMVPEESEDRIAANAPLLAEDNVQDNHSDVDVQYLNVESSGSGSYFIWALTFTAGISGLLFGYE